MLLLQMLSSPQRELSTGVLLGAVFIVGMSMWGSQRVSTLSVSFTTVLHSMASACMCGTYDVSTEVRSPRDHTTVLSPPHAIRH